MIAIIVLLFLDLSFANHIDNHLFGRLNDKLLIETSNCTLYSNIFWYNSQGTKVFSALNKNRIITNSEHFSYDATKCIFVINKLEINNVGVWRLVSQDSTIDPRTKIIKQTNIVAFNGLNIMINGNESAVVETKVGNTVSIKCSLEYYTENLFDIKPAIELVTNFVGYKENMTTNISKERSLTEHKITLVQKWSIEIYTHNLNNKSFYCVLKWPINTNNKTEYELDEFKSKDILLNVKFSLRFSDSFNRTKIYDLTNNELQTQIELKCDFISNSDEKLKFYWIKGNHLNTLLDKLSLDKATLTLSPSLILTNFHTSNYTCLTYGERNVSLRQLHVILVNDTLKNSKLKQIDALVTKVITTEKYSYNWSNSGILLTILILILIGTFTANILYLRYKRTRNSFQYSIPNSSDLNTNNNFNDSAKASDSNSTNAQSTSEFSQELQIYECVKI